MFVTFDQFYVATFIFAFGYLFSLVLSIFDFPMRSNAFVVIKNVLFFVLFLAVSVLYFYLSVKFNFPTFRIYMPIVFFFGLYSGWKTLRLPLAKLYKKLYNNYRVKKVKNDGR